MHNHHVHQSCCIFIGTSSQDVLQKLSFRPPVSCLLNLRSFIFTLKCNSNMCYLFFFKKTYQNLLSGLIYEGWPKNLYQLCGTISPENKLSQMLVDIDSMNYAAFLNVEWKTFSKNGVLIICYDSCYFQWCILLIWNKVTKCAYRI